MSSACPWVLGTMSTALPWLVGALGTADAAGYPVPLGKLFTSCQALGGVLVFVLVSPPPLKHANEMPR
jgi:hypothetical protein